MIMDNFHAKDCCGCTACAASCPSHAITMKPDVLGFHYPHVDGEKCNNCGLCDTICQFNNSYIRPQDTIAQHYYAARLKNTDMLVKSQSGGMFVAISDYILGNEGVVYGVSFNENFAAVHKRASDRIERDKMRGSKYTQSDLSGIFESVRKDLQMGVQVMFVGTPCQIAGLNAAIPSQLKGNLLLVDLICHGVAAPQVWQDYLHYLERKKKDKLLWVNFRDKEQYGWRVAHATYRFAKHPEKKVTFLGAFYRDVLYRESCGNCHFCNLDRPGDITIGDFWGNQSKCFLCKDDKGCSVVITNTQKGEAVFSQLNRMIDYEKVQEEDALQYNLQHKTPESPNRAAFQEEYTEKGFSSAMKTYSDLGWKKQMRLRLGSIRRRVHQSK